MAIVSYKNFCRIFSQQSAEQSVQRRGSSEISDNSSSAEELVFVYSSQSSSLRIRTINHQHHSPFVNFGFRHMG